MRANRGSVSLACKCFLILLLLHAPACLALSETSAASDDGNREVIDLAVFRKACESSNDLKAISVGESILAQLDLKYGEHPGFGAYKSKLNTAEFLAGQMKARLTRATKEKTLSIKDELREGKKPDENTASRFVAPARSFYEKSIELFSKPIKAYELEGEDKTFLAQYYDLKLRILISEIAQAGQALSITDPDFDGTHNYVLVLPLLHALEEKPVNVDVLPRWMQCPEHLDILSDSCLLHFGLPFHAMTLAKESAELQKKQFSLLDFYITAARKCWQSYPHTAADCLQRARDQAREDDQDTIVSLQLDLVRLWMDSKNYSLAAGYARKIFETVPDHEQAGEAIWLYFYCLYQDRDNDAILAKIDGALKDKRYEAYEVRLMYVKWCALRGRRNQTAEVSAWEHKFLERHGDNPIVAPVLLSRATDLYATEGYQGAFELLTQLVDKFPSTIAAEKAKVMLAKMKATKGMR